MNTEGTFAGNVGDAVGPRFAGAGSKEKFADVGDAGDAENVGNVSNVGDIRDPGIVGDVGNLGPPVAETEVLMLLIVAVLNGMGRELPPKLGRWLFPGVSEEVSPSSRTAHHWPSRTSTL